MRIRSVALGVGLVLAVAAAGCGDDAASVPTTDQARPSTSRLAAPGAETTTTVVSTSAPGASATTVPPTSGGTTTSTASNDTATVIEVSIDADGATTGDTRSAVRLGDVVTVRVTAAFTDELHLHGYDLFAEVSADVVAEITFIADVPGIFEAELEDAGIEVLRLEVS